MTRRTWRIGINYFAFWVYQNKTGHTNNHIIPAKPATAIQRMNSGMKILIQEFPPFLTISRLSCSYGQKLNIFSDIFFL